MNRFEPPPKHDNPAYDATAIRHATRREIPEISELVANAIGAYAGEVPGEVLRRYIESSRDAAARWDEGDLLVAVQFSRIIGTVTFYPDASSAGFPASWASFGTLAVHRQMQRRGTAELLVRRCIAMAIPVAPALGILTGSFMLGARRLYERLGFMRSARQDMRASDFVDIDPGASDVDLMAYRLDLDTALSG